MLDRARSFSTIRTAADRICAPATLKAFNVSTSTISLVTS